MFGECSELISLNLGNFDTKNIEECFNMFVNCNKLQKIIVGPNWDGTVFNYLDTTMFNGCTALVGGAGTLCKSEDYEKDGKYAHVDGGPSNPGYLTSK